MKRYYINDPQKCVEKSNECLNGHEGLIVNVCQSPFVETGAFGGVSVKACQKHNIPIAKTSYLGGSIVCFPGDVSLCETHWGNSNFAPDLVARSVTWLKEKGLDVTEDNNDVLVDGRKVISWARFTTVKGWCQSVVHYSMNVDLDLIKEICTKPMTKIPGALSKYGITTEEILSLIEQ